jgi:mannose-6-phosphate isomerase-like protein (cupin superfamily)/rubrerythrin
MYYVQYPNSINHYNTYIVDAIYDGMTREASNIDLYHRLLSIAPNEIHRNEIINVIDNKYETVNHLKSLYQHFTGYQPVFNINQVPFNDYREGLQKAYNAEVEGSKRYARNITFISDPYIWDTFSRIFASERENANRLSSINEPSSDELKDYGQKPYVVNIDTVTTENNNYRTALWTGKNLQVTLMSINVGDDIGLEVHPKTDQFIRIEEGEALVQMGDSKEQLDFEVKAYDDYAIMIPAGKWHNVVNTGNVPLKVYAIYAPPEHPFGTIHETKEIAMGAENE